MEKKQLDEASSAGLFGSRELYFSPQLRLMNVTIDMNEYLMGKLIFGDI